METFKKWKQDGPLVDHDKLRGTLRRSTLIRYGLLAFQVDNEEQFEAKSLIKAEDFVQLSE